MAHSNAERKEEKVVCCLISAKKKKKEAGNPNLYLIRLFPQF
jgi:hypothetical protein